MPREMKLRGTETVWIPYEELIDVGGQTFIIRWNGQEYEIGRNVLYETENGRVRIAKWKAIELGLV